MDDLAVDAYLARIGAARPPRPDDEALHELHRRHLEAVPFENLSIHLDEPMLMDEASLVDKIVHRRRGGICFELNGAFALLLRALGYRVTILAARGFTDTGLMPPFDHLAVRVDTGTAWLVEVGFGNHSTYPLRWDSRSPQPDPGGEFLLVDAPEGDLDVLKDGEPQYRIERRPRTLADFVPIAWWHQTSQASPCTQSVTCTLPTPTNGRVTLKEHRLLRTENGQRTEEHLPDDAAILHAYRANFGLRLTRAPHCAAVPAQPADPVLTAGPVRANELHPGAAPEPVTAST